MDLLKNYENKLKQKENTGHKSEETCLEDRNDRKPLVRTYLQNTHWLNKISFTERHAK